MDSYLKDELLIETNHDVIQHLEACSGCRRELAARREIRAQLRRAFAVAPDFQMRPDFVFQLRNTLKAQAFGASKPSFNLFAYVMRPQWIALAACLVVAVAAGVFALHYQSGKDDLHLARVVENRSEGNQVAMSQRQLSGAAVELAGFEVTERAVGDHRNCAIKYNLAEEPIPLEEAGRKYDAAYTDLAQAVRSSGGALANKIKYVEDHSCVYNGQRFAHVILEYKEHRVSLLVAETDGTIRDPRGEAISCSQIDGYQVSCFGTKRHTVFIVSDLPEADNLSIARNLAPAVSAHIARAEA
jgi:hypothetical protein